MDGVYASRSHRARSQTQRPELYGLRALAHVGLGEVMNGFLVEDLRAELARGRVVVLVGAGVSIGATGGAPAASWTGLLEDGVARCEALGWPLPTGWGK